MLSAGFHFFKKKLSIARDSKRLKSWETTSFLDCMIFEIAVREARLYQTLSIELAKLVERRRERASQ